MVESRRERDGSQSSAALVAVSTISWAGGRKKRGLRKWTQLAWVYEEAFLLRRSSVVNGVRSKCPLPYRRHYAANPSQTRQQGSLIRFSAVEQVTSKQGGRCSPVLDRLLAECLRCHPLSQLTATLMHSTRRHYAEYTRQQHQADYGYIIQGWLATTRIMGSRERLSVLQSLEKRKG
jgi:hypothetical protein